jgi:predicted transcriptional regulator
VRDKLVSINTVFKSLSDHKTLVLFDTIAHSNSDKDPPISKLEFTKKQYYSRIHSLTNSGLITRQSGKYYLTSFGRIVSFYQSRIARALDKFWKLKALDSISKECGNDLRLKELYPNLVSSLIEDVEIREILRNVHSPSLSVKSHFLREAATQVNADLQ